MRDPFLSMDTLQSISVVVHRSLCSSKQTYDAYVERLKRGSPTRQESAQSHFCVYFLPFNAERKEVFLVHHKKSGLWLSPGGHIDRGETLLEALNREIVEELGVKDFFKVEARPFLLTITAIDNKAQPCKEHYDVWYLAPTDGHNFDIDPTEFHETRWLPIDEARKLVADAANVQALTVVENF
jgi:8-oxo-dGTP pyrophosphatase MutT (NUDIX family)